MSDDHALTDDHNAPELEGIPAVICRALQDLVHMLCFGHSGEAIYASEQR